MTTDNHTMHLHDSSIELRDLRFYAYHGALPHEERVGNHYLVTLRVHFDATSVMESDDLTRGINYADLHTLVGREMSQPSQLLEHVAYRILRRIGEDFGIVTSAYVAITKVTPPIRGFSGSGISFSASAEY